MSSIAELAEDRVVEGVYAVARKQRLRTRKGAAYLALELVDRTGRIEARVWNDVELLDGRFAEGDAVRVLGRVSRFGERLQLEVRSVETAEADPAELTPALRRDADELDGFLEFLAAEIAHPGLAGVVGRFLGDRALRAALRGLPAAESHHSYAGGLLEHTVGVATLARETTQLHPRLRADLLLAAALLHDVGRTRELRGAPSFRATDEGRLLGHGASLSYGIGDFLGGLTSRRMHVLTVLALSQVAGALAVAVWVAVEREPFLATGAAAGP